MSQCATVQKFFSSSIEQSIDPESKSHLEQHLNNCPKCAKTMSDINFLSARFKNMQSVKASAAFDQNLRSRIIENRPVAKDANTLKTLSYGLSAAVILIAVILFINSDPTVPVQNQASPASSAPVIQSAGVGHENAVRETITPEQKIAVADNDSTNTNRLNETEIREVNLVDK